MLSDANYKKILEYFDRQFWENKTDDTNWQYYGIILDWYFENSVFSVDYLDVADYFDNNGGVHRLNDLDRHARPQLD